jgi:Tim44-like domain
VRWRRSWRARPRAVELAAAEAAEDDPAFAFERVRADAASLFAATQAAWDARDVKRLGQLVGPDLLAEWARRLGDFARKGWHNRVAVDLDRVKIDYVGLVNRTGDREDRVVIHVQAVIWDYVETDTGRVIPHAGSSGDDTHAERVLDPGQARRALDRALDRRAAGGRIPSHRTAGPGAQRRHPAPARRGRGRPGRQPGPAVRSGELADLDFEGPARAAALDLALADERFDPDLIEVSVRRILAAWASAIDGDDTPLEALARPEAVRALLYPGDTDWHTRLVVRNPHIRTVRITAIDSAARAPLDTRARGPATLAMAPGHRRDLASKRLTGAPRPHAQRSLRTESRPHPPLTLMVEPVSRFPMTAG